MEMEELKQGTEKLKHEMDKLKEKLEERQTSVTKVCSLLVVLFRQCPHSMDKRGSILFMHFSLVSMKVPAYTSDAAIQANYLSATESVLVF